MTTSGDRPPSQHLALDTSAYAHLRRRHPTVVQWLASADVIDVSTTVLGELEAGFLLGSRHQENTRTLSEFLAEPFVRTVEVTPEVARRYGQLFASLRRAGTPIPINDVWIAAAAIESGAHLVTFDGDFSRIDGLSFSVLTPE